MQCTATFPGGDWFTSANRLVVVASGSPGRADQRHPIMLQHVSTPPCRSSIRFGVVRLVWCVWCVYWSVLWGDGARYTRLTDGSLVPKVGKEVQSRSKLMLCNSF